MKKLALLQVFLMLGYILVAQNNHSESIKRDGNTMINSLLEKDYEKLSQFTYPVIVEWMGGKKEMINIITLEMDRIEKQGIIFLELSIGEPEEIYNAGSEIHCLVPQKVILESKDGKIINSSHLLAVSNDSGEHWFFVDTTQITPENVTHLFPKFNSELKIPNKSDPEFVVN